MKNIQYKTPFLSKLTLKNFMGFQEWSSPLSDVTVIIGNNTKGKTSVLNGVQVALGAFLQCIEDLPGTRQYRRQIYEDEQYCLYNDELKDYVYSDEKTEVRVNSSLYCESPSHHLFESPINWSRKYIGGTTTHNRACVGGLIEFVDSVLESRRPVIEGGRSS